MALTTILLFAWVATIPSWLLAHQSGLLRYLPALLPLSLFTAFALHAPAIAAGEVINSVGVWAPSIGVNLALRLDGFSLLFALLITGIGTLVTIYAIAYFSESAPQTRARFIAMIHAFMAAMLGTVLSDNLIAMFVFWEATSILSFLLIGFEAEKPEARKSALQSLLITGAGGLALFGSIVLIGIEMQTFVLSDITQRADQLISSPWLTPIILLLMAGAFTKSAQFPFHFWLPQAMTAPTPASAYLHSATMVKLGVYLLARFDSVFRDVPWFGQTLVIVGMITMLVAALGAIRATGYKGVLAQSTVASLGILVMLIGLDGPISMVAVCGFIVAHAFYKAALFFCAGTAIHATHISELRKINGLVRYLPVTGAAVLVASLSMAGLPPFVGFIAKEYLFEAQLASSWSALPVIIAVVVNGVMVAVAGVVSLRPFFLRKGAGTKVDHGETPGLLVGPVVLSLLGIAAGLAPGFFAHYLIAPAAQAIYGSYIDVSFSLWHGVTPMLGLSAIVVALGVFMACKWDAMHLVLNRTPLIVRVNANDAYYWTVARILDVARGCTLWLQNGDIRHYSFITLGVLISVVTWAITRAGGLSELSFSGTILPIPAAVLIFGVIGALVAARTKSLVTGLMGVGVVGFGSALFFLLHGAPDLALTQFAVETLVLIVLMAVLVRMPLRTLPTRSTRERWRDAGMASAFAVIVFVALASMLAQPFDSRLSDYFGATSYDLAHGLNVVNVIIVDYRALDTVGEIAVVAFATLGVWALLRKRPTKGASQPVKRKTSAVGSAT